MIILSLQIAGLLFAGWLIWFISTVQFKVEADDEYEEEDDDDQEVEQ